MVGYLPQLVEGRDLAEACSKRPESNMGKTGEENMNSKHCALDMCLHVFTNFGKLLSFAGLLCNQHEVVTALFK